MPMLRAVLLAREIRAEQHQHALHRDPHVGGQVGDVRERRARRPDDEPAELVDQLECQPRDAGRDDRAGRERQLIPVLLQRAAPPVHPDRADDHERHDSLVQDQRIADLHPGQQHCHQDRSPPARPHPIQDQPDHQHRDLGAGVVGARQQRVAARPERRREHDPAGDQHPDRALASGGLSPGQQRSAEHQQRVAHRPGNVYDIGVQPVDQLHQRVLRQLGGVERQVRGRPAPQQHVAVQHVPGLQRERPSVRIDRNGLCLP